MGSSCWSDESYRSRVNHSTATRGTAFTHDADIREGVVDTKVHDLLNPHGLKVRESRDSAAHPDSNAVIVALDVTGSMASVVKTIHATLPTLMGLLLRGNYLADPQILFCAVGDATCDRVPLQVGQFESGEEMEGDLSRVFLEQGGGGQKTESYELAAYLAARKTSIDCWEKRGRRGYMFFIGDELPYPKLKKAEVDRLIGAGLEVDVPVEELFRELQERYTVFYVLPVDASHGSDREVSARWEKLVGVEHVLRLEKADGVAALIATQIGLCEGVADADTAAKHLEANGVEKALAHTVVSATSKSSRGGSSVVKMPSGTLAPSEGADSVRRL